MQIYTVTCHNKGCPNYNVQQTIEQEPGTKVICGPCGGKEITDVVATTTPTPPGKSKD
jgi:hypothetical protein